MSETQARPVRRQSNGRTTETLSTTLPRDLIAEVRRLAEREGVTNSLVVATALRVYLDLRGRIERTPTV